MTNFTRNTNMKGARMSDREQSPKHTAKTPSHRTGIFATLRALLRGPGTGAPSSRRLRAILAALALAVATFAVAAAPALAAPLKSTCCAISEVSYTSAHLTGKTTSSGLNGFGVGASYTFEYSTSESGPWNPGFEGFYTGVARNKTVDGPIEGLKGGTEYFVRLRLHDNSETTTSPATAPYPSFTTLTVDPPQVLAADDASKVFSLSATATGEVKRPANADPAFDIECRFEYATEAEWQGNANAFPAGAPSVPCIENPITKASADGEGKQKVSAHLPNLTAATTYHLRLAAENDAPGVVTKDATHTFTTDPTVAKPTALATDNASEVEYTQAQAKGEVQRPAGEDPALDSECRFEYVTQAQFEAEEFAAAEPNGQIVGCSENPITSSPRPNTTSASAPPTRAGPTPKTPLRPSPPKGRSRPRLSSPSRTPAKSASTPRKSKALSNAPKAPTPPSTPAAASNTSPTSSSQKPASTAPPRPSATRPPSMRRSPRPARRP
jgi:hypothetical protein